MRLLIALLFIGSAAFAQTAQREIDEQVWKSFIKGFNENNAELFMSVHSKDLVRSPRDAKKVLNWDQYNQQTAKQTGVHNIELRFTERVNNETQAIDVGIYKTSYPNHPPYYGRFHVVLRKENGVWKILVDTDSNEGNTIGEAQFLAAKPME
jgi:ketosteroid isomerase-like protein